MSPATSGRSPSPPARSPFTVANTCRSPRHLIGLGALRLWRRGRCSPPATVFGPVAPKQWRGTPKCEGVIRRSLDIHHGFEFGVSRQQLRISHERRFVEPQPGTSVEQTNAGFKNGTSVAYESHLDPVHQRGQPDSDALQRTKALGWIVEHHHSHGQLRQPLPRRVRRAPDPRTLGPRVRRPAATTSTRANALSECGGRYRT